MLDPKTLKIIEDGLAAGLACANEGTEPEHNHRDAWRLVYEPAKKKIKAAQRAIAKLRETTP